jgi:hypothetical protein
MEKPSSDPISSLSTGSEPNVQQNPNSVFQEANRSRSILKTINISTNNLRKSEEDLNQPKIPLTKRRSIGFMFGSMNQEKIEFIKSQQDLSESEDEEENEEEEEVKSLKSMGSVAIVEPAVQSPTDTPAAIQNARRMSKKKGSVKSLNSYNSGGTGSEGSGKPLVENFSSKVFFFQGTLLAFLLTCILVVYAGVLYTDEGFMIKIPWIRIDEIGPIMLVTLMWAAYVTTHSAMNDALSVYFGILLTQPRGFTVAVAGMVQANFFEKLLYSSTLSVRSKAKKLMNRLSFAYLFHVSFMVIPLMAVLELSTSVREIENGGLSCIVYHQRGRQSDRGWPTFNLEMGVGEYVFGTSIGILRSQEDVPTTTFIMSPQLTDTCMDGTTIYGDGFTATISTECICAGSSNTSDLIDNGIPSTDAALFSNHYNSLGFSKGMVNGVYLEGDSMIVHSLLAGSNVCGGGMSNPVPVCITNITNLMHASIRMVYMTDGTPASIAAKKATILETKEKANMTWLFRGYLFAMGNRIAPLEMPGLFPNTVNPLLWWTTQSTLQISPSLLEAGLETTFALMNKAVIQRAFGVEGHICPQTVVIADERVARVNALGIRYILIFVAAQFAVQIGCVFVFFLWAKQKKPVIPAIRFVREKALFAVMTSSASLSQYLNDLTATYETGHFWPKYDFTMRVGESITTLDDPDYGTIVIDRPKMVGDLSFTKLYL